MNVTENVYLNNSFLKCDNEFNYDDVKVTDFINEEEYFHLALFKQ